MKVIVLHGNNVEKSYARLSAFIDEAKKRGWKVVNDKIEETQSLFGEEKLIIIRDIKLINSLYLKLIGKIPGTLVIYSEKKLSATFLKTLPKDTKVETYELPFLLWKFLDNFDIKLFQELVKHTPVEMVLAMMAWKLKKKYISNPTPEIGTLISQLAEIDVKAKTGKCDLKSSLDLFIVKRLV